jgi:hypothetical protein
MSDIQKQFEKWWDRERLSTAFDSFRQVARESFQAGYKLGLENAEKERMAKIKAEREAYEDWQDRYRAENRRQ